MPEYFDCLSCRSTFAEKMKTDFRSITQEIKKACLGFGLGSIKLEKDDYLWIYDYENHYSLSFSVNTIKIDYDYIILVEKGKDVLSFDDIYNINKQIDIYELISKHQDQLHYYELDWDCYFKALLVSDCIWRVLTPDEARHLWYNGRAELFQLYDDGTEGCVDDIDRLNECINNGYDIGVSVH